MEDAKLTALLQLIETIYETTVTPDAWERALAQLCVVLVCDSALIRFYQAAWSRVTLSVTHNFDKRYDDSYRAHFVKDDPIIKSIRGAPFSAVLPLERYIAFKDLKKTEFYNDYLLPQDKHHIMGMQLAGLSGGSALFGVQRGRSGKPFDSTNVQVLERLSPHLQQAFHVSQLLAQSNARKQTATEFMEHLDTAIFYFDDKGLIQSHNAAAQALLDEDVVLSIQEGCLSVSNQQANLKLQEYIQSVAFNPIANHKPTGGALTIVRRTQHSPALIAVVTPHKSAQNTPNPYATNIVGAVFVGHQGRPILPEEYLKGAYGLTPMEARLTTKLIEMSDLGMAAEALGIQTLTARSYLKTIFKKIECKSQSELVAHILSGPIGLWARGVE